MTLIKNYNILHNICSIFFNMFLYGSMVVSLCFLSYYRLQFKTTTSTCNSFVKPLFCFPAQYFWTAFCSLIFLFILLSVFFYLAKVSATEGNPILSLISFSWVLVKNQTGWLINSLMFVTINLSYLRGVSINLIN